MARINRPQPTLHSIHKVISYGPYLGKQGLVTYVGKYGYTLTLFESNHSLPISLNQYQGLNTEQVEYPINPDTNQPCQSAEEFKHYYPEYFI